MKNIFFIFFPIFLLSQTDNELKIRILQDKRVEQSSELFSFLQSGNARERELAALAIANIQDTSALERVAQALNDEEPAVRTMASFAIGMIGKPKGASLLFRRLAVERNEKCVAELFNALGLCGTSDDLKMVVQQAEDYRAEWKPYVVQAIIRFANRKIKDVTATKYVATLLYDHSTMINATYALMRINDTAIVKSEKEKIQQQLLNSSSLLRMWSATTLSMVDDDGSISWLLNLAKSDKDWRVRVNALRALRSRKSIKRDIIQLISDKNEHVALAAISSYDAMVSKDAQWNDSSLFISMLQLKMYTTAVKEEVRLLIAKKLGERALPYMDTWKSDVPTISAQRVRALGETRSEKVIPMIKEAMQQSKNSLIIIAGVESFQSIAQRSNETVKKDFLKSATLLFAKNDPGISYSSAVAFQDTSFSKNIRRIYQSSLVTAFQTMKPDIDLEPMVELLNVFAAIGDSSALPAIEKGLAMKEKVIRAAAEKAYVEVSGNNSSNEYKNNPNEYQPFYTIADVGLLNKYRGAEIFTSKGKIKITFEKEAAPFTVLNFILLTQKKFYDGLSFHRVVSNFVIQGGDPLGNGSGGPNFSIRTEVYPNAKYKTGAVGMASAGKDTEGSQWFITHCPAPHLDYRYTVFGYTTDSKIVDQIMIGDTIERAVLF